TSFFEGDTALGAAATIAQLPAWFAILWLGFRLFEREPRPRVREVELAPIRSRRETERELEREREAERLSTPSLPPASPRYRSPSGPTRRASWAKHLDQLRLALLGLLITIFAIFPVWWITLQAIRPTEEDQYGNPFWTWDPTYEGLLDAFEGREIWVWM